MTYQSTIITTIGCLLVVALGVVAWSCYVFCRRRRSLEVVLLQCPFCECSYSFKVDLDIHYLREHLQTQQEQVMFNCWLCKEAYSSTRRLAFHLVKHHKAYKLTRQQFSIWSAQMDNDSNYERESKDARSRRQSATFVDTTNNKTTNRGKRVQVFFCDFI